MNPETTESNGIEGKQGAVPKAGRRTEKEQPPRCGMEMNPAFVRSGERISQGNEGGSTAERGEV